MNRLVIWDLDGTLTDSRPWIYASYRYGAMATGRPVLSDDELSRSLCGNIFDNVRRMYGIEGEEALEFVRQYRRYYAENCDDKVELFAGVRDVLSILHQSGVAQAVATMKPEGPARSILERLGVAEYFLMIRGTDFEGTVTKADMIRSCLSTGRYDQVFMVGDCPSDRKAADSAGVGFIAVTYGYGYSKERCIEDGLESAEDPVAVAGIVGRHRSIR